MRLSAIFLGLLMATGTASAEWVQIGETDSSNFYIDPATIRKDGNLRKVWEITDLKQRSKDGAMSVRVRTEYDCKNERFWTMSLSDHSEPMAGGETLNSFTYRDRDWRETPPGSVGETMLKIVCTL